MWMQSISQWPIRPLAGQLLIAPVGFYTADSPLVGYLIVDRKLHCNFCLPHVLSAIHLPTVGY